MLKKIAISWMLCAQAFAFEAEAEKGIQYVAKYAMQTAKSKNFQDLSQNLFSDSKALDQVNRFLKINKISKRSLPDVIAEGTTLTIRERTRNSTLDLSKISAMKVIYNKQEIIFTGKESFREIYHALLKKQYIKQSHIGIYWFLSEAEAALPVLSVVTLSSYTMAALSEELQARAVAAPKETATVTKKNSR